jgi:hypothetical protein
MGTHLSADTSLVQCSLLYSFLASLGMLSKGEILGWTNAANPQLRGNVTGFGMDDDGSSWVGSTVAIGGIVGSVFAGEVLFTDLIFLCYLKHL